MVPSIQTHPSIVSNQLLTRASWWWSLISHFNTKTRERIFKRQFELFSCLHLRGAESDIKSPLSWCFFICISKFSTYFVLHFSYLIYIWALAWSVIVWWWRLWLMSRHITKQLQVGRSRHHNYRDRDPRHPSSPSSSASGQRSKIASTTGWYYLYWTLWSTHVKNSFWPVTLMEKVGIIWL